MSNNGFVEFRNTIKEVLLQTADQIESTEGENKLIVPAIYVQILCRSEGDFDVSMLLRHIAQNMRLENAVPEEA